MPLALSGSRREPDPAALAAARELIAKFASWQSILERKLFAHYEPYAGGLAAGGFEAGDRLFAPLGTPAEVWPHVTLQQVSVTPLDGVLTTELDYTVDWDEEHTLGARFRAGTFVELNGSVLLP